MLWNLPPPPEEGAIAAPPRPNDRSAADRSAPSNWLAPRSSEEAAAAASGPTMSTGTPPAPSQHHGHYPAIQASGSGTSAGSTGASHGSGSSGDRPVYYAKDFNVAFCGKLVATSKRRIRWRFGFADKSKLAAGHTGSDCRGEEHDVTIIWSVSSGKILVLSDGVEVYFSERSKKVVDFSWKLRGGHDAKIVAYATSSLRHRDYELWVNGKDFFTFPRVNTLGLKRGTYDGMSPEHRKINPYLRDAGDVMAVAVRGTKPQGWGGGASVPRSNSNGGMNRQGSNELSSSTRSTASTRNEAYLRDVAVKQQAASLDPLDENAPREDGPARPKPKSQMSKAGSQLLMDFLSDYDTHGNILPPATPSGPEWGYAPPPGAAPAPSPGMSPSPFDQSPAAPSPGMPPSPFDQSPAAPSPGMPSPGMAPSPFDQSAGTPSNTLVPAPAQDPWGQGAPAPRAAPLTADFFNQSPGQPPSTPATTGPFAQQSPAAPTYAQPPAAADPFGAPAYGQPAPAADNPYGQPPAGQTQPPGGQPPAAPLAADPFGAPAYAQPTPAAPYGQPPAAPQASDPFGAYAQPAPAAYPNVQAAPVAPAPKSGPALTTSGSSEQVSAPVAYPDLGVQAPAAPKSGPGPVLTMSSLTTDSGLLPGGANPPPEGGSTADAAVQNLMGSIDAFGISGGAAKPPAPAAATGNPFDTLGTIQGNKAKADNGEKKPVMNAPAGGAMVMASNQGGNWQAPPPQYPMAGGYGQQQQQPPMGQQPGYGAPQYVQQQPPMQQPPMHQGYGAPQYGQQQPPMQQPGYGAPQYGQQQQPPMQQPGYGAPQYGQQPPMQQNQWGAPPS